MNNKRLIDLLMLKTTVMKKVLLFALLGAFLSACSSAYTCPTYSKKEIKKVDSQKRI
jgi:peroxiredoxin